MEHMDHWNNPIKIKQLINRLVETPSISGTIAEVKMAKEITKIIQEIPFFQKHPEYIFHVPLENDLLKRETVMALFKGNSQSSKTIILLSHFDVVGIEDFGTLKSLAFQPDEYTNRLKESVYTVLNKQAQEDLDSGNWLFGRGTMDMKAGLAIQLAVLSELAQQEEFDGNIILVATPDEETNSLGMFAAVKALNHLKKQYDLDYLACICSEPTFGAYPNDRSKYIYLGSVGKLLPAIFCVGKETHVGEPMEGLNAAWMAATVVNHMELADEFIDRVDGEASPPPTALKLTDLKDQYNVQTPSLAYVLYNVLTLQQSPTEVLRKVESACEHAALEIFEKIQQKYRKFYNHKKEFPLTQLQPKVYTYHELFVKGKQIYGDSFENKINHVIQSNKGDYREMSISIASKMAEFFLDEAPFYLILLAPPYYPHVYLDDKNENDLKIKKVAENIVSYAKAVFDEEVHLTKYFTGLSDVSYCRVFHAEEVASALEENMPLFGNGYHIPLDDICALQIPTINIGPQGIDAHKHTERLELHYSTNVVPHLLKMAIKQILE